MDEQKLYDILGQNVEAPDLVNKKLEQTYARLEDRQPLSGRKGPRPLRMALIAAALAAVGLLCVAAGVPYQVYNFFSGGSITVLPEGSNIMGGAEMAVSSETSAPLILENGRLWFVNGEERTDITDLIDEETPYIHEHIDPVTNQKGYVIMGGTVDNFGWAEYAGLDGGAGIMGNNFARYYVILDGERFLMSELTSGQLQQIHEMAETGEDGADQASGVESETVYSPWLENAMEQLGIEIY